MKGRTFPMSHKRTNLIINRLLPVLMAFMLLLSFGGIAKAETAQKTDVVEISSVEDLSAINQNLSGHYVLIADIDLEGRELGLSELTPAMCRLDYTMSEAGGADTFIRTYTLASGGPYCDCGYKKRA